MRIPLADLPLFAWLTLTPTLVAQVQEGGAGGRGSAEIRTVDLDSMSQSDPFILADPITRMYYMTG